MNIIQYNKEEVMKVYLQEMGSDINKRVNRNVADSNHQEWDVCNCGGTFLVEASETDMEMKETLQGLCLNCGIKEIKTDMQYDEVNNVWLG
jgi:hypothetical protein